MSVYVINKRKEPLMPTRSQKARKLLKSGKAKIVKREPFTIQLLQATGETKQKVTLGVDSGSKVVGISATTEKKELYVSEVILRNDIVNLLSTKRQNRRTKRNRLRYREPRFNNRTKSKKKGWLGPSIEYKINTHLTVISKVCEILPIDKIIVETASFDTQKLKNDKIEVFDYQQGNQLGFWNVREYVLFRDNHKCQHCKGKSKDKILNVHHIESRKTGGDSPSNLVTLCNTCHNDYHKGKIDLKIKKAKSYRDATFMGIMRWTFYNNLKETYSSLGVEVKNTFGYLTKNKRIENNLPKEHCIDAYCIAGNLEAKLLDNILIQKKIRQHNRQIHKAKIQKGGFRKRNQAEYLVKGFRLFDKVTYKGQECFITGRRKTGYFALKTIDYTKVHNSAKSKDLKLVEARGSFISQNIKRNR
ncbi:MAG: RNA-guided endonuclease IscB [Bacillota bacterium]|nr:RNA-guided endonuclease IscB [Bacillota bacterium]